MSNPTTPFSWQMPTATDLVTDLPADFEVFGQAVATSMADLLGGTTGQILAKNSATDMDFIWTTANPGDITGVTAGTGISGGGTSGDVTVTNSMATAIDAKGDLIAGTAADTFSRLAVGTNGQTLVADSTASTGLKWATPASGGSMTQLATGTLSGTSTQIASINGSYKDLRLVVYGYYSSAIEQMSIKVNADTGTNYLQKPSQTAGASVALVTDGVALSQDIMNGVGNAVAIADFYDYAATNHWKSVNTLFVSKYDAGTAYALVNSRGAWINAAAITSIELRTVNGNSWTTGTYVLYGVN